MAKKKYIFSCSHQVIEVEQYRCAVTDFECYTRNQARSVIDFFLLKAMVPTCSLGGSLADCGWKGAKLGTLEKEVKKVLGIGNDDFIIARTETFPATVKRLGFSKGEKTCIECPRAIMTLEYTVVEGSLRARKNKTRMGAFLNHIRNSIAHGNTFLFPNGNILLIDKNRNNDITGCMLIPAGGLLKIIDLINGGPEGVDGGDEHE